MILKNFKSIKEETFEFENFDLIVGANNSGKSTCLQALAIWQYCVDMFRLTDKRGSRGIQIVLPNFTALPLPEFNLLWTNRTAQQSNSSPIYIEINVFWYTNEREEQNLNIKMYYQSSQTAYASPDGGWDSFKLLQLPVIVYVPPFSGLEPHEKWLDDGPIRQNIGKAQPGSVLRNLLYRIVDKPDTLLAENKNWKEVETKIKDWFGVNLVHPRYQKGVDTEIKAEYKVGTKKYDIISGGSGFHQILTILGFLHGYPNVSTILFDEPDAHLHVNLQRKIVEYFKLQQKQFLIATHSEEFIKGVDVDSIISVMSGKPKRVQTTSNILKALSEVDNMDVIRTRESPYILYLEGEDDDRVLSAWANIIGKEDIYHKFYFYPLGGGNKLMMKTNSDEHFRALREINTEVKRAILLDFDESSAYHPNENNPTFNEWKRRNIDNYLLVPTAWKRAVLRELRQEKDDLFSAEYTMLVDDFFTNQNLTLPKNASWKTLNANIFQIVDGKKILFENSDSLFNQIKTKSDNQVIISRTKVASAMNSDELHEDIEGFFNNLEEVIQ
jgi:energy-coupling factor transporter ATP-binding protein EcfA2